MVTIAENQISVYFITYVVLFLFFPLLCVVPLRFPLSFTCPVCVATAVAPALSCCHSGLIGLQATDLSFSCPDDAARCGAKGLDKKRLRTENWFSAIVSIYYVLLHLYFWGSSRINIFQRCSSNC